MKIIKYVLPAVVLSFFTGCVQNYNLNTPTNAALYKEDTTELLQIAFQKEQGIERELYFADTQGIIFNSGSSSNELKSKTETVLNSLFGQANLRNTRNLKVSLNVDGEQKMAKDVRGFAESYLLSKRYKITNLHSDDRKIVQKVLKEESDALYKNNQKIKLKDASDIILYFNVTKNTISTRIIGKNGSIIGSQRESIVNKQKEKDSQWITVEVFRANGSPLKMSVMKESTNVVSSNFVGAEEFCAKEMQGQLITPYVFEAARKDGRLIRPSTPANKEIIAPYDEDEHEVFFREGDNIETLNNAIIIFHWNTEKYFEVPNLFRSNDTSFRCMRNL